jgi:uncharacterized protein (TIGR03437 family)
MSLRSLTIYGLTTLAILTAPKLSRGQNITTVAGGAGAGFGGDGGAATSAMLNQPTAVVVDGAGNLFIADYFNHRIRKVNSAGVISTIAGDGTAGFSGDGGPATSAQLNYPWGIAVDGAGSVYFTERLGHRVRKVDTLGIITTVAGNGTTVSSLSGADLGDGGLATKASLYSPFGVAVDAAGNIYIGDTIHNRVRKVNGAGVISTLAGTGNPSFGGDGGPAISAQIYLPYGLAVDAAGNLYISGLSNRIRKVNTAGIISTVAGAGNPASLGDGGPAINAGLNAWDVAVDSAGNLFLADTGNNRVRKVDTAGIITTISGGNIGALGDGGPAINANLGLPSGVAVDSAGNVYVADNGHDRIRKIAAPAGVPAVSAALNGASFATTQSLAPGSLASLFGRALGSSNAQASAIPLPVSLGGVSVTVGGVPAPLLFVSGGQINFQVPWTVSAGTVDVVVTVNGTVSAAFRATVGPLSPGIFSTQFGSGQAIAINADGSLAGPAGSIPGIATRPAKPGETIIILATGLGAVSPSIATGAASSDALRNATTKPSVLIAGAAAQVSFAGLSPQFVGVNQLNVVVPSVPAGVVSIQIEEGGIRTTDKVTIAVGNP